MERIKRKAKTELSELGKEGRKEMKEKDRTSEIMTKEKKRGRKEKKIGRIKEEIQEK